MVEEKIYSILCEIEKHKSTKLREQLISENQNVEGFLTVLDFLFNPYIVTGIKARKLNKFLNNKDKLLQDVVSGKEKPLNLMSMIEYLKVNNTGRDKDAVVVATAIVCATHKLQDFYMNIACKTLKVGVSAKTINASLGRNLIPEFNVMLARKYEDVHDRITGEFFVTLKLDGTRVICYNDGFSPKFYTRKGKQIEGLVELEEEFSRLPVGVYDGELLLENVEGLPSDELFRETQSVSRRKGKKTGLEFHVFEYLELDEFNVGKSKHVYSIRRKRLEKLYADNTTLANRVKLVEILYQGKDKSVIPRLLSKVMEHQEEGLMINRSNCYYVTKRTDGLIKVKEFYTIDLRVTGYEEGEGKNKGMLGALIVDYKGNDLNVGSGYSDLARKQLWESKDNMIGKIIEVCYFRESKNEKGKLSLRFPTFVRVRWDKNEVSYD